MLKEAARSDDPGGAGGAGGSRALGLCFALAVGLAGGSVLVAFHSIRAGGRLVLVPPAAFHSTRAA
jgi:hypothetical protein